MKSQPAMHPKSDAKEVVSIDVSQGILFGQNIDETEILLTKKELAQRLKKSVRSIENWMKLRYLPYIKIGHSVLFRWRDVVEALDHFHVR